MKLKSNKPPEIDEEVKNRILKERNELKSKCDTSNMTQFSDIEAALVAVHNEVTIGWQPLLLLEPENNLHSDWMQYAYLLTCIHNAGLSKNRRFSIVRNS